MGGSMEAIVGIICEYDPFHRGHRRQFDLIRAQLPGARILCPPMRACWVFGAERSTGSCAKAPFPCLLAPPS